ncbi:hypothetical protein CBR_g3898 [Chara braunii]|uniref:AMP-activated protein kinase glycogen-binding domain-containing protein n=1 Tax=Chara braunii TaxID=69332 RepID=A0A388KGN3_CHABU|nr:hypothetical protein CBR_g3898 [Chara braunii]|eukprot:GBG69199.1 hypothetical protein CBR_g3898 [Chara braunii]
MSPESTGTFTQFTTFLRVRPGKYEIKFLVDGEWMLSPNLPVVGEGLVMNNLLMVIRLLWDLKVWSSVGLPWDLKVWTSVGLLWDLKAWSSVELQWDFCGTSVGPQAMEFCGTYVGPQDIELSLDSELWIRNGRSPIGVIVRQGKGAGQLGLKESGRGDKEWCA